jgi:hypothetical protein
MKRVLLFATACAATSPTITVPPALVPPAGQHEILRVTAKGAQIYVCADKAWTLQAPDADLFDEHGAKIGHHSAGPTWALDDDNFLRGNMKQKVDAPTAGAIPWLLVEVTEEQGPRFEGVKSVQRLQTSGGVAPAEACVVEGELTRVNYSATYVFWR